MKNKKIIALLSLFALTGCEFGVIPTSSSTQPNSSTISSTTIPSSSTIISSSNSSSSSSSSSSSNSSSTSTSLQFDNLLEEMSKKVGFDGSYLVNEYEHELTTLFGEDYYYSYENSGGAIYTVFYRLKDDGIYLESVNKDNVVEYKYVAETSLWEANCGNPFKGLTSEDFVKNGDKYALNENKIEEICPVITGWNDTFISFELSYTTLGDISVVIDSISEYDGAIKYTFDISLDFEEPKLKYEENETGEKLEAALKTIGNNYTLVTTNRLQDEEDVVSTIYRTENVLYNSYEGASSYYLKDGKIYTFEVEDSTAKNVEEALDVEEFSFEYTFDFSMDLFTYNSETATYETVDKEAAMLVATYFAYDPDTYEEYSYFAEKVEVKLDGDNLHSYTVYSNVYDYIFETEYKFSNIGTTTQPFDVSSLDKEDEPNVGTEALSDFYGEYVGSLVRGSLDGETEITFVINENGITLNGVSCRFVEVVNDYGVNEYKFMYNDIELYFSEYIEGNKDVLMIYDYEFSIVSGELTKKGTSGDEEEPVEGVPSSLVGTWVNEWVTLGDNYEDYYRVTIEITEAGLVINCEELQATVAGLNNVEFTYSSTIEEYGETILVFTNSEFGEIWVLVYGDVIYVEYEAVEMYSDSGEFSKETSSGGEEEPVEGVPSSLVGTWVNEWVTLGDNYEDYYRVTIEITEAGLVINCEELQATVAGLNNVEFTYSSTIEEYGETILVFTNSEFGEIWVLVYGDVIYVEYEAVEMYSDSGEFSKETSSGGDDTTTGLLDDMVGLWSSYAYSYNDDNEYNLTLEINADGTATLSCDDEGAPAEYNNTFTLVEMDDYGLAHFIDSEGNELICELWDGILYVEYELGGIYTDSGDFVK